MHLPPFLSERIAERALLVYNAGEEPPHGPTVRGGTRRTERPRQRSRKEASVPCGKEEIMRLPHAAAVEPRENVWYEI